MGKFTTEISRQRSKDGNFKNITPSNKNKRCAEGNPDRYTQTKKAYDNPIK